MARYNPFGPAPGSPTNPAPSPTSPPKVGGGRKRKATPSVAAPETPAKALVAAPPAMAALVRSISHRVLAYATPPSADTEADHTAFLRWIESTRPDGKDWREAWTRFRSTPASPLQSPVTVDASEPVTEPMPQEPAPTPKASATPAPTPARRQFIIPIPVLV